MSWIGAILRELLQLFVGDGRLALYACLVIAATALAVYLRSPTLVSGAILIFGILAVLVESVWRAASRG